VLVAGFSHGVFEMLQLPEANSIHTLSVSRERLTAAAFNTNGDWLALGCARLGQLLVWEWRSETYVLKQQVGRPAVAAVGGDADARRLVCCVVNGMGWGGGIVAQTVTTSFPFTAKE